MRPVSRFDGSNAELSSEFHEHFAGFRLGHVLEVADAVVAVVHVYMGQALTAIEHREIHCIDVDGAPTR